MAGQLAGKIALVTGGSSGIGRAVSLAFAREGAKVVVANRGIEGGNQTVQEIRQAGGDALFVKTDVAVATEVEALVRKAVQAYGRLDCAVNNAGASAVLASTVDCTEEIWDRTFSVNLKGVWLCMKYEIPAMLQQGGGAIVNMASAVGLVGLPGLAAQTASKHGVVGLTKAAALEYAQAGIRINAVCPAVIRTPGQERFASKHPATEAQIAALMPMGRIGTPEEVAETVVFLCSGAASFITGHAMLVDGGCVAK